MLVIQLCPTFCNTHGLWPARLLCPWKSPGKNTGVGCRFLLQVIFPTQGSNPHLFCLLYWLADSLPLSHQGEIKAMLPLTDISTSQWLQTQGRPWMRWVLYSPVNRRKLPGLAIGISGLLPYLTSGGPIYLRPRWRPDSGQRSSGWSQEFVYRTQGANRGTRSKFAPRNSVVRSKLSRDSS